MSALVPLRVRELDGPLPRLFAERPVGDLVGSTAADSTARLATAVGRLPTAAPPTGGEPARHPGALPEVLDVPARNTAFTGRDGELEALREGFTGGGRTVQVVTGLGGVGKTQTAAEYAHRFRAGYDLIWWIAAQQVEYLAPQLAALAPGWAWKPATTAPTPPAGCSPPCTAASPTGAGCWCWTTPARPSSSPAGCSTARSAAMC